MDDTSSAMSQNNTERPTHTISTALHLLAPFPKDVCVNLMSGDKGMRFWKITRDHEQEVDYCKQVKSEEKWDAISFRKRQHCQLDREQMFTPIGELREILEKLLETRDAYVLVQDATCNFLHGLCSVSLMCNAVVDDWYGGQQIC